MRSETTQIDAWIKKRLLNEVMYKVTIWSIASITTYLILAHSPDFSVMGFFKSYIPKNISLINTAFPLTIIFTLTAFLFKDMSTHENSIWQENRLFGMIGMVVRKICTEALLWSAGLSYGVFLIILITLIRVLSHEGTPPLLALGNIAIVMMLFLFITVINFFSYCFVRWDGCRFISIIVSQKEALPLIYILFILTFLGYVYIGV